MKQLCNVEGEILSGIICIASSSWTDACFLSLGGEGRRNIEGEQNVEKEEHEGGVKVDELPVKVDGRRRTAPGHSSY